MKHILFIRTLVALGPLNVFRVFWYRVLVSLRVSSVIRLSSDLPDGLFFYASEKSTCLYYRQGWGDCIEAFGIRHKNASKIPPEWNRSIITQKKMLGDLNWFEIDDFDHGVGDIKALWEISRFDWVIVFAQQFLASDSKSLDKLNVWLLDWINVNKPYRGANWKCGQEASIRVMHLAMAAFLLGQIRNPQPALVEFVLAHLKRIEPTISYAIAQDNNHGTSEAAALFIGGTWLNSIGVPGTNRFVKLGRRWLENRASRLILPDGTFSQYSVNYHRLMLDTYSWTEFWRRLINEPPFSTKLYCQIRNATDWLGNMVFSSSGDVPNIGANDGSRLIPLSDTDYRDYRPSVQLASVLFKNMRAFVPEGPYNDPLKWLGLDLPSAVGTPSESRDFEEGGFLVMRNERIKIALRYPNFKFRPSQSDLLHLDCWVDDLNLLRDAGTYSYNSGDECQDYFGSVAAHNTVQFDFHDQMPKLSRFLYGAWPHYKDKRTDFTDPEILGFKVGYQDWKGATHHRELTLFSDKLLVVDCVAGFKKCAVLRWRLAPDEWHISDMKIKSSRVVINVNSTSPILDFQIIQGLESRYYSQKTSLPVLQITVGEACCITSEFIFII